MGYDGSLKFDTSINENGFNKGLKNLGSIASKGMSVLAGAVAGVTAAMGAGVAASVKVGMDFEAQMSRVQAISGTTRQELEALREQAIQLGADTAFSATQAAEGMENLAAAGFTTNEIMEAMPGLLAMAAASGEDLANSSDIAASTLRGFGLEASQTAHVADVLAENANRTNASIADTGEAMKYISPLARAAGISFEETAAAIGIMSNAGIKGSQAGVTLRGALSRLSKPTDDMIGAMEELGISFYDTDGKMKPLSEQIGMLQKAFNGMTDEQKNNYMVTLYGQEALSGMLALINEGEDSLSKLTRSYEDCGGAAQKAADIMQDNLKSAIEQLGGSAESLGIELYRSLQEPLKGIAEVGINAINELTEALKTGGVEGLIQAGGQVLSNLLLGIAKGLPNVVNMAAIIIKSIFNSLTANIPQLLSSGMEIVLSLISGMMQLLPSIGTFAITLVTQLYEQITAQAPVLLQKGYELLNNLITGFVEAIPEALPKVLDFIQGIGNKLAGAAPVMIQKGFELLGQIVQGIVEAIPILIAKVPEIISTFANVINDNFPTILAKGFELLWKLIKGIISAIPDLIANIPKIISAIVDTLMAFQWLSLGRNIIKLLKDGIMSMVGAVKSAGIKIFDTIRNTMINLPSTLSNLGKSAIHNLSATISGLASSAKTAALKVASAIETAILRLPGKMLSIGKNIVKGLWDGISGMVGWITDKVMGFANSVLGGIKKALGIHSPSRVMRDEVGKMMALGMGIGFEKNIPEKEMEADLGNAITTMKRSVNGITSQPISSTGNWHNSIIKTIAQNNLNIDYERLGKEVGKETAKAIEGMGVYLDKKPVGKIIAPEVDKQLGRIGERRT